MTKFDRLIGLGDETAEMLFADDEDHHAVVKGEAEIGRLLAAVSASVDASLKDDLLLIQEHKGEAQMIADHIEGKKRKLDDSKARAEEAKAVDEQKLGKNKEKIDELKTEKAELDNQTAKLTREADHLKDKLKKEMAVAKAKLRTFAKITGIEWDADAEAGGDVVSGVFSGETRSAPFHFEKKNKSSYDITNALWNMMDDGGEDDDCW